MDLTFAIMKLVYADQELLRRILFQVCINQGPFNRKLFMDQLRLHVGILSELPRGFLHGICFF